jgi:hypothetical protein
MIGFIARLACVVSGHADSWYSPVWHVRMKNNYRLVYVTCGRCNALYLKRILSPDGERADALPTFPNYVHHHDEGKSE